MTREDLNKVLENHKLWIHGKEGGQRANLSGENLRGVNFSDANLRCADLRCADLKDANLKGANLRCANLSNADLRNADFTNANLNYADLTDADLRNANLRGADLDFSCLPLWCGSLSTHFDDKQLIQIAYHLVKAGLNSKNVSDETKEELSKLIDFANKFHRVNECGKILKGE